MSNFYCEKCGKPCIDSPIGYVTGCEHYPADVMPLPADEAKILHDNLWELYKGADKPSNAVVSGAAGIQSTES